jgi:hypothetical protein
MGRTHQDVNTRRLLHYQALVIVSDSNHGKILHLLLRLLCDVGVVHVWNWQVVLLASWLLFANISLQTAV